jgi:GTPase
VVSHRGGEFVVADIPGLIEGAAEGAGVGDRFLGHIERCQVLLHLVDATGDDPVKAWRTVRKELKAYGAQLTEKIEVIGLNKIDALEPAEVKKLASKLKRASKEDVFPLSGAGGEGVSEVLDRLADAIGFKASAPETLPSVEKPWSPL